MSEFRIEKDSMGEIKVPKDALYAAQTQRAVNNFPISGIAVDHGIHVASCDTKEQVGCA